MVVDSGDTAACNGYTIFPKLENSEAGLKLSKRVKYGGVRLIVRDKFCELVTQVDIPCTSHDDGVLWCLIGHILFWGFIYPPFKKC